VAFGAVWTVIFAGHVIVGGCVSFTVTVNEEVLPAVVVIVTVVVPTGKKLPEAGLALTTPQVPDVVGVGNVTTAPHWFGSLFTTIFAGGVIEQAWHSAPASVLQVKPETLTL
jgi:hypothetical protein